MHTDAHTNTDVGRVKDTVSYRQTNTHTNPISHPDGDRAAADVVGRAGALLAQVTCSQQLAQVRHSWELKPQGKCSRWLGGWRCGRQAGRLAHHLPYTHTLYAKWMNRDEKRHRTTVTDIQKYWIAWVYLKYPCTHVQQHGATCSWRCSATNKHTHKEFGLVSRKRHVNLFCHPPAFF